LRGKKKLEVDRQESVWWPGALEEGLAQPAGRARSDGRREEDLKGKEGAGIGIILQGDDRLKDAGRAGGVFSRSWEGSNVQVKAGGIETHSFKKY